MLPKKQRCTTKEVRFLIKKRTVFFGKYFIFSYRPQYPNNHYHQFSCHVGLKVHKSAVIRNMIKRAIFDRFQQKTVVNGFSNYLKIYCHLSKQGIQHFYEYTHQKLIASNKKKSIHKRTHDCFDQDFDYFVNKATIPSHQNKHKQ